MLARRKSMAVKQDSSQDISFQSSIISKKNSDALLLQEVDEVEIARQEEEVKYKNERARRALAEIQRRKQNEAEAQLELLAVKKLTEGTLYSFNAFADLSNSFRTMFIADRKLNDIEMAKICKVHKSLFSLDLRSNKITDLAPIKSMKYLVTLNAASNAITSAGLAFNGIDNLQEANLTGNKITKLDDLKYNRFLKTLILDGNLITSLETLNALKYLRELSICDNKITSLEPLRNLPLKILNVVS
jgi:Leucine-rich repeat (LRR) protein